MTYLHTTQTGSLGGLPVKGEHVLGRQPEPLQVLAKAVGNRATARLLARAPETWYRGEGVGVPRAKPGGVVHDLADGLYFIDDSAAAQRYGDLRAGKPGGGNVVGAKFDRRLLGRVLDLTTDDRWSKFINDAPPVSTMGKRWRDYMAKGSEPFNGAFREYLTRYKIRLADYDAVIAQDFIRNPNARQLVITNPRVAEKIDDMMARVDSHAPPSRPGPPVTVKGGGSPGGSNSHALPSGPSASTRGGPGADGPQMQTDASGRVLLYRAIGPAERDGLIRHGDFEWAPSGGGKYFSFSKTDALEAAKKLYGQDVTIVETAVPRGFVPDQPDVRETVAQPHLPAKGSAATMIHGEVFVFYDPRAGGWSLHVDDDALLALNAQMIRPRIIVSTLPTVGRPSGSVPPAHDGGHGHEEPVLTESAGGDGWHGKRVGTGRPTGEITVPDTPPKARPPASTTPEEPTTSTTSPKGQPSAEHPMDVEGVGELSPDSAAPAASAVADLLSVIFGPYMFPEAEQNYRKRLRELRTNLEPSLQARIDELLMTETPRIAQLSTGGRALYITVKLAVWTQHSDVVGVPANLVNLLLDDVMLGTKNINEDQLSHSLADAARGTEIGHSKSYQLYSIPVPAAVQQEATRRLRSVGASELRSFNQLADNLKDSRAKVRTSAAINLARLAKDIGSLRDPAIQHLIPILGDDDDTLRATAAVGLGALGATEAIPAIRQALANIDDDHMKAVIQKTLDRLDETQKRSK